MGIGGISIGQLLLVFLIAVVLFGTKKLRTLGQDLGAALHGFKKVLKEGEATVTHESEPTSPSHIDMLSDNKINNNIDSNITDINKINLK